MKDHYHLTYTIEPHPDGIGRGEVLDGHGATDALIIGSILFGADGSRSYANTSMDGRTGKALTPDERFKFWSQYALDLAETLPPGARRDLCRTVFETIRRAVLADVLELT
jgi:hypothetical protein